MTLLMLENNVQKNTISSYFRCKIKYKRINM